MEKENLRVVVGVFLVKGDFDGGDGAVFDVKGELDDGDGGVFDIKGELDGGGRYAFG